MNHKGTVVIETEKLILRPFIDEDAQAAFNNWESDERVTEFLRWPTYHDVEDTKRIIHEWVQQYADPTYYQWAIVLKSLNEPIGSISVVDQDEKTDKVHIGYCIGSRWWHMGITSEALIKNGRLWRETYGSFNYLACNNGSSQCITYRTWNLCLEKVETHVVLVGADS
ncbi:GNAT family N-acetyltransferase [Butyrivibrio sp. AC2005]|uniref:GNAT family N-acetyltransferase n=1 Tax=Butyrivibrio sp. AC2005 TaxID=1280672 RepID=UPI0004219339|nr:GNAT family N-acetyltransferase [Butyrivibrio sp. AC2005]